jgi:SagB-type dehydrogenase family enzyme
MIFKQISIFIILIGLLIPIASGCSAEGRAERLPSDYQYAVAKDEMSLDDVLKARRSVRRFDDTTLTGDQLLELAWAGQGITEPTRGFRTAPSAGALYPLELYLVAHDAVYHYNTKEDKIEKYLDGDRRTELSIAAVGQNSVAIAAVDIVIAGIVERTAGKYKDRAERYVLIETGHVAQNILLKAVSMGLGGVPVGAFHDDQVSRVLELPENSHPYYILAIGYPESPDTPIASVD